jgi:hypothetical protein
MPKMDKKQRREKKREDKAKRIKMKKIEQESGDLSAEALKFGKVQIYVFLSVAIAGALFIVLNV